MQLSTGIDAIEISRISGVIHRHGTRFLRKIYTERELNYCQGRHRELAARFAAKEAISKVLGTGLNGIFWREMEVIPDARGKPHVELHGNAKTTALKLGITTIALSLTHTQDLAIASAVAIQTQ